MSLMSMLHARYLALSTASVADSSFPTAVEPNSSLAWGRGSKQKKVPHLQWAGTGYSNDDGDWTS